MVIVLAVAMVLPVLIAVLAEGMGSIDATVFAGTQAAASSVLLATLSTGIALPLAWGMGVAQKRYPHHRHLLMIIGLAAFVVPPAVIATGWFLAFRNFNTLPFIAILIAAMNALMSLPFILSVLAPAMERNAAQHDRLCQQLNLAGWNRFWLVDAPVLRAPLAQAGLMAFVLSMGDLTAVTLARRSGLGDLAETGAATNGALSV